MFIKTIRKFFAKDIKPLGRWHRIYDQRTLAARIDLANYDHCGPCGNEDKIPVNKNISHNNTEQTEQINQTQHFPVGKPNAVKFDIEYGAFK